MNEFDVRDGEQRLAEDPAMRVSDGGIVFICRITSPWATRDQCPKNMAAARERSGGATVHIDGPYRPGLQGLDAFSHVALLTWLDRAPRDLIVQKPRHAAEPRGVFALRTPARPNPIGLHVVRLLSVDVAAGQLTLEAIDVLDGTPVIDVKPYYASTDSVPQASRPGAA